MREVCRLRVDQDRSTLKAEITERSAAHGVEFDHLVVPINRGLFPKEVVVGAHDGVVGPETLERFLRVVGSDRNLESAELVHTGPVDPALVGAARQAGVWLRSFAEYQQVWDHRDYLRTQTRLLTGDTAEYPLHLHVDKHWSDLGEDEPRDTTASVQLRKWLHTSGPRFVLVLGDFGTGKTFLLRWLAATSRGSPISSPCW